MNIPSDEEIKAKIHRVYGKAFNGGVSSIIMDLVVAAYRTGWMDGHNVHESLGQGDLT